MMVKSMRKSTLETLGLGSVIGIFRRGGLPVESSDLVDEIFGEPGNRGSLVISGAGGIVGAGKAMQLGSRLSPFGVTIVGLDFPEAPDSIGGHYPGLVRAFGRKGAGAIMAGIVRFTYDGVNLPAGLKGFRPRLLIEAIPEIIEIKKAHYEIFRKNFPGIDIRSVTSGFPMSELGVGIAHPAFPHEVNKVWEVVEPEPSPITHLLWALGLIPIPVSDNWSFVLDVLFCGLTLAGLRYHEASGMPFWKIDKYIRRLLGPNPFRAHDAIGAKGANFLTWSCLHHLSQHYGELFRPTATLDERREGGQNWYPLNHFRPLVDWSLEGEEEEEFLHWIMGPLFQMACLMLMEKRAHPAHINAIGELCAQFRRGILAVMRDAGPREILSRVEAYHRLHPEAGRTAWYPDLLSQMGNPEWQQLYVNAEHDGDAGVITISREAYNSDVDMELNRAIDWLKEDGIRKVIVTGDFHLSTQMIGADITEFFPALTREEEGYRISSNWSRTARRLHDDFEVSVGLINGKRCLGGFLELMLHCHYLLSVEDSSLGMPEVTLPVVPGMEGCHWPFRKAARKDWPALMHLLLTGKPVKANEAVPWLIDHAAPLKEAIRMAQKIVKGGEHSIPERNVEEGGLEGVPGDAGLPYSGEPFIEAARKAIMDAIQASCSASLREALDIQSRHSAGFMTTPPCMKGSIGTQFERIMKV